MEWKNRALELVGSRCGTKIQNNLNDLWKRREGIKCLWPWPAQPPDLSPIENVWRILKGQVRSRNTRSKEQLRQFIIEE